MHSTAAHVAANPFAMLIDPQSVVTALDRSDRLSRLKRQVFRPLDKPLIARVDGGLSDFDSAIDDDEFDVEE